MKKEKIEEIKELKTLVKEYFSSFKFKVSSSFDKPQDIKWGNMFIEINDYKIYFNIKCGSFITQTDIEID